MFADDDPDSHLLWSLHNAGTGRRIAKRKVSMGEGCFSARYAIRHSGNGLGPSPRYSGRGIVGQPPAHPHGGHPDLAQGQGAQDGRRHATSSDDVHASNILIFLLQFCGSSGVVLHCPESFQHLAILSEQESTHAEARKSCAGRKKKTMMTPKDLLDTMLGYLGFVVQIEETKNEGGNLVLQIYTEESRRLIGRDGETLEAIQFLLNRLLQ